MPAPHLLAACLCVGLGLSLVVRAPSPLLALAAAGLAVVSVVHEPRRAALLALGLALAGLWWGAHRLEGLDRSVLEAEIGRAGLARVEVTGAVRRSEFAVRVPVRVLRLGSVALRERSRLDLPPERAPPRGALLDVVATVVEPRGAEDAGVFDEAAYLRRQGVHVVLRASSFTVVGRRGGLGGVADGLRSAVSRSLAAVPAGERRAVLAGVVLGDDEGIDADLRASFRSSGLYHLLAVSGQNVAYVMGA